MLQLGRGKTPPVQAGNSLTQDQNLLFGILAIQLRLISNDDFIGSAAAWAANPDSSLADRLVRSELLSVQDRELLDQLVTRTIDDNRGDLSHTIEQLEQDEAFAKRFKAFGIHERPDEPTVGDEQDQAVVVTGSAEFVRESPGRYTRSSEYSRGGMGRILLVHDQYLERDVALKELLPPPLEERTDDGQLSPATATSQVAVRFLREARVTGQLEHPSVVPVYEMGRRANGTLYYTMKLVRGRTLADALRSTKTQSERLSFLSHYLDLCHALAYAHSRNVVHRDVKPSNIMIGEFGETVVIDWGLAKILGHEDSDEPEIAKTWSHLQDRLQQDAAHTVDGVRLGTPQYMAPEQAEGRIVDIDQQTDVFALGVVLYQILTGETPFDGKSSGEIFERIIGSEPTPIRELAPDIPPELVSICERAMAKSKRQRYQSAKELADDVQRFLTGSVVQAYNYSPLELARNVYRRHRAVWNTAAVAMAGLLLIGCFSYWNVYRSRADALLARDQEADAREAESAALARAVSEQEQTAAANYLNQIRFAAALLRESDFRRAREILWETDPQRRLWEWGHMLNHAHGELYSFDGDAGFAPSNDGEQIASYYTKSKVINIRDARSGDVKHRVAYSVPATIEEVTFSPDDRRLLARFHNRELRLWNVADWQPLPVPDTSDIRPKTVRFVPDGRILMTHQQTVQVWDRDLGELMTTLTAKAPVQVAHASADSARVMGALDNGELQVWDLASGDSIGLLEGSEFERELFSPSGKQVARVAGSVVEIWDVDSATRVHRLDGEHARIRSIAFDSPGTRLLVTASEGRAIVWDTTTGKRLNELRDPAGITKSWWSPDDSLVYTMQFRGVASVWELNSNGARLINRLEHTKPVAQMQPIPNSTWLATRNLGRTITVSEARTSFSSEILANGLSSLGQFSVSHQGDRVALSDRVGVLSVVDIERRRTMLDVTAVNSSIGPSALNEISPDGEHVVARLDRFLPMVFHCQTGELVAYNRDHNSTVTALATSDDSRFVATAEWNGTVHVWEIDSGVSRTRLETDQHPNALRFTPDGSAIVVGYRTGRVSVFDLASKSESSRIDQTGSPVTVLRWSDDGQRLAIGYQNGETVILHQDGSRTSYAGQSSRVHSLIFVSGGARLLVGFDRGFRIWDVERSTEIVSLAGPLLETRQAERIPDSDDILLLDDRNLRRWNQIPEAPTGTTEQQQLAFERYRQQVINQKSVSIPIDRHARVMVFSPLEAVVDRLRDLADSIRIEPSDAGDDMDSQVGGWLIADDHVDAVGPLGIQQGDRLTQIANQPVIDAPSAQRAVELALQNVDQWAQELSFDLVRNDSSKRIFVRLLRDESKSMTVSLNRERALAMLSRLGQSIRIERADHALEGYTLPPITNELDREFYLESEVGPYDRIVAINDQPIRNEESLKLAVDQLRTALQSGERSSYVIDVRRGSFCNVRIEYETLPP